MNIATSKNKFLFIDTIIDRLQAWMLNNLWKYNRHAARS